MREWESGGVGEWRSGGEERAGLDQRRRAAAEPAFRLAWFGGPALEFRGNCAAERVKPLACLGADRNNSGGWLLFPRRRLRALRVRLRRIFPPLRCGAFPLHRSAS